MSLIGELSLQHVVNSQSTTIAIYTSTCSVVEFRGKPASCGQIQGADSISRGKESTPGAYGQSFLHICLPSRRVLRNPRINWTLDV